MGPTLEEFLYGSGSGYYFTQALGMSPYECSIAGRKGGQELTDAAYNEDKSILLEPRDSI